MGSRLLKRWLIRPIRNLNTLIQRQQIIAELQKITPLSLASLLQKIGDLERILARVALRTARPRDLVQLRQALNILPSIKQLLEHSFSVSLEQIKDRIENFTDLFQLLNTAVMDNPAALLRDGGVIANGYDKELDQWRQLTEHSEQFLIELEAREKQRSGLSSLKVGLQSHPWVLYRD